MRKRETLKFKSNEVPKTSVNAELVTQNEDRTVFRPMNCRRILSVSVSEDNRARLLLDNREVVESNLEQRKPWRWRYEVHVFPTQDNSIRVRGCHTYQHFLLRNQKSLRIELNGVQIESTAESGEFEIDIREENEGFEGWTVMTNLYDTDEESNSCAVVGFSRQIDDFTVMSNDMRY